MRRTHLLFPAILLTMIVCLLSGRPMAAGEVPPELANLPPIRLLTFYIHDTDEGNFWTPHPQDYALLDKLLLKPGEPMAARFQAFGPRVLSTRFKDPRVAFFALNITDGDPQLIREGRHQWPGMYPTLVPVNWLPLPTVYKDGAATADTKSLKPGTYRVRVAIADGADPKPDAGIWADDAYVVIAETPHSMDLITEQNRHVYFRGESIPATLVVRSTGDLPAAEAKVAVLRGDQPIGKPASLSIPAVAAENARVPFSVDTTDLAPGTYRIAVDYAGLSAGHEFEIVDPVGPSPIAISESQIPGAPFANTLMGSPFGGKPVDSLAHDLAAPYADLQITSFRNELAQGYARKFNQRLADTLEAIHAGPAAERIEPRLAAGPALMRMSKLQRQSRQAPEFACSPRSAWAASSLRGRASLQVSSSLTRMAVFDGSDGCLLDRMTIMHE